jgi:outer membrane receptor protein involved in Fe transport
MVFLVSKWLNYAFINPFHSFLPSTTVRYKLTSKQNIQASFNQTIKRPYIYQLNPYTSLSDPYTISKGNPFLKPEMLISLYLEHSIPLSKRTMSYLIKEL